MWGWFIWGEPRKDNIDPMYDMEQYSFCKILDKMTNPIWREKKYTGEDPESQLREKLFFVFLPKFKIFLGQVPSFRDAYSTWFFFFFFQNVPRIQAKSVTWEGNLLRFSSNKGLDQRFTRSGCFYCWLEMALTKFKWADPYRARRVSLTGAPS